MPHRSRPRRSIPAAALGDFSPIDPRPGGAFAAGTIPPPEIQFDFSIMDAPRPSPLQLPSPQRHDAPWRSRTHLPTIPQIAESLFGESSSSSSSTGTTPTPYTASDLLQLSAPASVLLQPRDVINHPPARHPASYLQETAHMDSQPPKIESNSNAIDFRDILAPREHCIFQREDCTDTAKPKYVCYGCSIRTKRQTRRRERIMRKILLLGWLGLQAAIVALLTYTVMAAKHTRAMRQIVDQFDQMC